MTVMWCIDIGEGSPSMSIIIIDNNLMLMLSASVLIVHDIMLNLIQ